ncbi:MULTISPECIES: DUF1648 domain-containing protein [unclassified Streptomyces]|uniref:DUF1648 domain-containing protein n=1 Tax=unclassified Streptomyces TaxID=2593676 RepID=UPI0036EA7413
MMRKNVGRATLVVLPFLLALGVDLVLLAVFRDRLPAQLASHFRADGQADGHAGQVWYVVTGVLLFAVTGVLWGLMATRGTYYGREYRWLVAGGYAVAGFFGWVMAAALIANVDAAENAQGEAYGVSFPMWQLAVALGVAVVAGGLGAVLAALAPAPERPEATERAEDGARIALADGEVAGWARSAGGWWLPVIALGLVVVGMVLLFASGWVAALPPLILGALLAVFARPYVVVDRRGITISGMLPWPRLKVPLDRIESATSRDINPLAEYGGWGYRIRPGRSGLMIRSGEGIVATLAGGRVFAVTVDDSATGAALLNTLIDRRQAER